MYFSIWTCQDYERSLLSTYFYHYVQEEYKLRITLLFTGVYQRLNIYIYILYLQDLKKIVHVPNWTELL